MTLLTIVTRSLLHKYCSGVRDYNDNTFGRNVLFKFKLGFQPVWTGSPLPSARPVLVQGYERHRFCAISDQSWFRTIKSCLQQMSFANNAHKF